ncbi:MAG: hypothetical protein ACYC5X_13280 [Syntrophales bacterium]
MMTDLPSEIFKKYGILSVALAILAASLIWFLAHWAASPGTEVSVLWGLVKYTKPADIHLISSHNDGTKLPAAKANTSVSPLTSLPNDGTKLPAAKANTSFVPSTDSSDLTPMTIELKDRITSKDYEKVMVKLRETHKLRELTALESGKVMSEIPSGTFFFMSFLYITSSSYQSAKATMLSKDAERFRNDRSYIEVHNISRDGIYIIGFLTESDAAQISVLSGTVPHTVVVTPIPWGSMTTLVSLPLDRIISSGYRIIQASKDVSVPILDIKVK